LTEYGNTVQLQLSILQFMLLYCNAVAGIWEKFALGFCVIPAE